MKVYGPSTRECHEDGDARDPRQFFYNHFHDEHEGQLGFRPLFPWMGRGGRGGPRARMSDPRLMTTEHGMHRGGRWGLRGRGMGHRGGRGRGGRGGCQSAMGIGDHDDVASIADNIEEWQLYETCSSSSNGSDSENEEVNTPNSESPAHHGDTATRNEEMGGEDTENNRPDKSAGNVELPPQPKCLHRHAHHRHQGQKGRHGNDGHCHCCNRFQMHRGLYPSHGRFFCGPHPGMAAPAYLPPWCPPPFPTSHPSELAFWHDRRHAKKAFKKSMKKWHKAWKCQRKMNKRYRGALQSDGEGIASSDHDGDCQHDFDPELPPSWVYHIRRRDRRYCCCALHFQKKKDRNTKGQRGNHPSEENDHEASGLPGESGDATTEAPMEESLEQTTDNKE